MARAAHVIRQRDFSGGQIDANAKRRDDLAIVRAGARSLINRRLHDTGPTSQRPGRRALYAGDRCDQVRMASGVTYTLCFSDGTLKIRNSSDTVVATQTGYAWTQATLHQISWARFKRDIVICFNGEAPKIARWDGATTWTFHNWAFRVGTDGISRLPYYRLVQPDATMVPGATTGSGVSITFSADVLVPEHVGAIFRFCDRRIQIATVTNGTTGTGDCLEPLPGTQTLTLNAPPTGKWAVSVGHGCRGVTSGCEGTVTAVNGGGSTITVQITNGVLNGFQTSEYIVTDTTTGNSVTNISTIGNPAAVVNWDEQIISDARGWPYAVTTDRNRLVFTDIPALPGAVLESAIDLPYDFEVTAEADGALAEIIADNPRIYFATGGPDQFLFTDVGVYYIPISAANPLAPGSVEFRQISSIPCARVQPRVTSEGIIFANEGANQLVVIQPTGQTAQPYVARGVSELHSDLFDGIVAIAVADSSKAIPERYVYVLNDNGSLAVGKLNIDKEWVGWVPWDGVAAVTWVSALGSTVLMTTAYEPDGETERRIVETVDVSAHIDCQVPLNAIPSALAADGSNLWFMAGATVEVMDGNRYLGQRTVNSSGVLQTNEGETLGASTVVVGYGFTSKIEPFLPHANEGQDGLQAMRKRQIKGVAITVMDSTGFSVKSPDGSKTYFRRAAYNAGENQDGAPTLREETVADNISGGDFDPRFQIVKDTPGPLTVLEITTELEI